MSHVLVWPKLYNLVEYYTSILYIHGIYGTSVCQYFVVH